MKNPKANYTINWYGPVFSPMGYARHNREMIWALDRQGINIKMQPTDKYESLYFDKLSKFIEPHPNKSLITVYCIPTCSVRHDRGYAILLHTIESKAPHPGLLHRTLEFSECWVPCEFNFQSMTKAMDHQIPLVKVPEGIDTNYWKPQPTTKNRKFTFITLADWSYRKGVHELVQAFKQEFKHHEAELWLITKYHQTDNSKKGQARVRQEAKQFAGSLKDIRFFFKTYTDMELMELFSQAHCFVLPTKGEAWCLPAIEAMSCELPCILPKIGGHREFFDERFGWLTSGHWDYLDNLPGICVDFYQGQLFYFPDIPDLQAKMRFAYEHQIECRDKGRFAKKHVSQHFTWDIAGKIAADRIKAIYKKGYTPYQRGSRVF